MRVLALGETNAARSQMAEGWLRALSTPEVVACSAGRAPTRACPEAVAAMREVGVDLLGHRAKGTDEVPPPDAIFDLSGGPLPPGLPDVGRHACTVADPCAEGSPEQRMAAFRRARDEIGVAVDAWLRAHDLRVSFGEEVRPAFALQPDITFLNHGSYGATPLPVLEAQRRLVDELEAQPVAFFRAAPARIRRVAARVASALRADPQDLVFVDNATAGISAVLRSLDLRPGDVLFATDHAYGAIRRALEHLAARTGARLVVAEIPFPIDGPRAVVDAVAAALPDGARLAVFDAITSATSLVFPVDELVALCHERGVPVLVDAAHLPGHLPVDLGATEAEYWVGNCHKWMFSPKGCAVLHVRRDLHDRIEPLVWSWGLDRGLTAAFDWQGTRDPSPWLAMEAALEFPEPYGPDRIRAHNVALRRAAAARVAERLGVERPAPESMLAAMATLPLPHATDGSPAAAEALAARLWERHRIEAVILSLRDRLWLRISAQIYNHLAEYEHLADRLAAGVP